MNCISWGVLRLGKGPKGPSESSSSSSSCPMAYQEEGDSTRGYGVGLLSLNAPAKHRRTYDPLFCLRPYGRASEPSHRPRLGDRSLHDPLPCNT
jgi:hypothetical protein